ncbi:MAG TPA: hypothetical protein DCM44_13500 [Pantoea sp.]|uniref:sugar dehydrogenase complex small subunit n=1 Tax=Pantoea TaxID=53335 RepID=UPI000689ED93|nr:MULTISPECIES: sugar dehydrogenase complex small subunit [Pantoea]MCG7391058.1 sorbitol dehydrogenase family protein [Pantoea sp. ACRSB]MDU1575875.1 sugar dehydrogenase complex small subunit [Pantoea sp.]MDU6387122.1 sugar dehydrogenase complex small subunit [Pantoea sp.]PNK69964.1 hypothetical protein A6J33_003510 [Pantoea sp. FDAARGOS_194]HAK35537.1 hypothetical protein [Pantoea sp.]
MNRRHFLRLMLASGIIISVPITGSLATAAEPENRFHRVSQALTGRQQLDPTISQRLYALLTRQNPLFPQRLAQLAEHLSRSEARAPEALLASLSEEEVNTALAIITPWYLGYTGNPATTRATDDAHFVSFLSALMYEPTADLTPRPSYSQRGSDYWQAVPDGVSAPQMPATIHAWGKASPRAASGIAQPQPAWLAMVEGRARTYAEALRLTDGTGDGS